MNLGKKIEKVDRSSPLPLSFAQQRLWFLDRLEQGSATYNIPMALRLGGRLDEEVLGRSLDALFARHEALRTVFVVRDGEPEVRLLDAGSGLPLIIHDLREAADREEALARLGAAESGTGFDLERGPLIRARLVRLGDEEHVLLLTMHHIVSDGWSIAILNRELNALYAAFLEGSEDPLPPLAIQYPDYAVWQREWLSGERLEVQADYWRKAMAGAPPLLELPTDRPRPAQQDFTGAFLPVELDGELAAGLRRLARRHGTTLFATLLAAWSVVLSRLSGQDDVVIGTPSANRGRHEIEDLIGFFVNTLALRVDLSGEPTVSQLVERVRSIALAAQDNQDLPFEQVVEIVQPPRRLDHAPLFQVMFAWQNNEEQHIELPGLQVQPAAVALDRVKFDLELSLGEWGEGIAGGLGYATALFDAATVERHRDYLLAVLRAMVADGQQPVMRIDILPAGERRLLLEEWNATGAAYPEHLCIHELFEEQVARAPDAVALVFEGETLTYGELDARANRLAHHLIGLGVKPDDRVAICVERSFEMVTGLLAILKAGGCYVPLDPQTPPARQIWAVLDCSATLVLAREPDHFLAAGIQAIEPTPAGEGGGSSSPGLRLSSERPAYVMYTSGSTGTPKGAVITHGGVVNLTLRASYAGFSAQDRFGFASNPAFDSTTLEIWAPLLRGAAIVVIPENVFLNPHKLALLLQEQRVSVLILVAGVLRVYAQVFTEHFPRLRYLITGGDVADVQTLRTILTHNPPEHLVQTYGPTETTQFVTAVDITGIPEDARTIPIGRPISNTRIYLLDGRGEPVPLGATGEIHIGGAGVARGYLNRPELTAERFVASPFVEGDRLYRTGDLARYLPDGNIEFLGRNDHQVKIRGFRIELGEIEARLAGHPDVGEAVVVAREDDAGDRRLVAYVVASRDAAEATPPERAAALRAHLTTHLPDYMVPAAYVTLDALPLTPNGKLDRKALPAPEGDAFTRRAYEAPRGEVEETLAAIWSELLGVEQISRHDNFFELGGHSLLAIRLLERLRQLNLGTEVRSLFASPVLADLASTLGGHDEVAVPPNVIAAGCERITPQMLPLIDLDQGDIDRIAARVPGGVANIQDIYALSPLQEGILFHHLLAAQGDPYLLVAQVAFADRALLDRYVAALQQVVDRHDILRTAFFWQGLSTAAQVVLREARLVVEEIDLDPDGGSANEQLARRFDPRHHRIDLSEAPLQRLMVAFDAEGQRWLVHWLQHHLIGDHSTMETLFAEVEVLLGDSGAVLAPARPFRDLVAHARLGVPAEEHERFFRDMLGDIDEPTTPFGLVDVHLDGDAVAQAFVLLPQGLNDRLRAQARRLGVSLASLCHLAWGQVLARATGREAVVFGTVLFGRMHGGEGSAGAMGLFINTLPLRLDLDGTRVEDSVRATHARLAGLLRHEHASLATAQRCSGVPAQTPLFSALLNYRHNSPPSGDALQGGGDPGFEWLGAEERTNYPVGLSVEDFGDALGLTAQVVDTLPAERICGYMERALESLAEALEHAPDMPVRALDVLPAGERRLLLEEWNATGAAYPEHLCIHELFEEQVARAPDAVALVFEGETLTYGELDARANRLAHHLIGLGVKPDDRVAICVERSFEMVTGLLAILKAGGCYVPLDPAYPAERLGFMLADAAPRAILTHAAARRALDGARAGLDPVAVIDLVADAGLWAGQPATSPDPASLGLTSRNLAYIIYTSGSTGTPKGVMVEHAGAVNHTFWFNVAIDLSRDDKVLQRTSIAFDASVWEIWSPLAAGAQLRLARVEHQRDIHALQSELGQGLTILQVVPSLLEALARDGGLASLTTLRTVFCGGEVLSTRIIEAVQSCTNARVVNLYGPTEATIDTTHWTCPAGFGGITAPIGRPISNTRIYLLDGRGEPVPLGATGEIHIGGAGVARGYLNRPELTAERFVASPFVEGDRLYRTGDLARYLPDGNIEFLGRNDHQVKIRGFRIELGEIEARLAGHPDVGEAVVVAREDDAGDRRLVAYVVASRDAAEATPPERAAALRAHLATHLPDYMVPAAYVTLDALPLTPNGKLDRKALPAPEGDAFTRRAYEAPRGEVEETLAAIWSELLGVEQISRHDNFFELGGHSLLAVRLQSRVQTELAVALPLARVFDEASLTGLAQAIEGSSRAALPPVAAVSREGRLPLSFAQQRLWFLDRLERGSATYNIPMALRLGGRLDEEVLGRSLDALFARHEALRTVFVARDGEPEVRLLDAGSGLPLIIHDLREAADREEALARLGAAESGTGFDLERGPLIRARLVRLGDEEHVLLLTMHHIVSDGWSIAILNRELNALYAAFLEGSEDPLPPLAIQYPDYAVWQREWLSGERLEVQADYWRKAMAGAPPLLELPTDRPRPAQQDFTGAFLPVELDGELAAGLRRLARRHGTTLFATLLAAWSVVLSRLSGQDDVVIGTPSANRGRHEIEDLIGFFVNTLALRVDLSGEPTVSQLVERVRSIALAAQDNQDLPFEQVVEIVQPPRRLDHAPLFQVMFAWQNNEEQHIELPGLQVQPAAVALDRVKFDLELSLGEWGEGIAGGLGYATALFDAATVERHRDYLLAVLRAMVADGQQPVMRIDILPAGERRLLLEEWNATGAAYPEHLCIHELFEEQVARAPDAVALVFEGETLTYGELDARANRLAHHLIGLGVKPDDRVAICVERSFEMVTGLLAILKAGGCYVPLDPQTPPARQIWAVLDCSATLVLAREPDHFLAAGIQAIEPTPAGEGGGSSSPGLRLSSERPAYVMYTSGSTGTPKGAVITHGGVVNLTLRASYAGFSAQDRFGFASNPAFDSTTLEIWAPLLRGAAIVVIPENVFLNPHKLALLLQEQRVSVLILVAGVLRVYAQVFTEHFPRLRYLITGGDVADVQTLRTILTHNPPEHLVQTYGPTETTQFVTAVDITGIPEDARTIPIGRPISNTRIYLLDGRGEPVPLGATGEIHIGGAGVARGYLNRPELTAERFVASPFVEGDRLYRTGDLARYLPDGNIEFLGRNDHQVKIRGFRIELGEIEARLAGHPDVGEAVVVAREDDAGDRRLVAYVVASRDAAEATPPERAAALRAHLTTHLPDYMVPAAYVTLDALPLTPNGKLDRKALPAPEGDAFTRRAYEAPRGEVEETLAAIWSELLGVEQISRHDNFFELGGHSLLAIRLLERLRQLNLGTEVRSLFASPVLADLAESITSRHITRYEEAVPIRVTGTAQPLFITPAGSGDYSYAVRLAEHIDDSNPIYALPWPSFPPRTAMSEIAASTAAIIRRVQSDGPYRLLGYSSGGILTYAIAHHLAALGEKVSFLGLIDTPPPTLSGMDHSMWLEPKQMLIDAIANHSSQSSPLLTDANRTRHHSLRSVINHAVALGLISEFTSPENWEHHCAYEWAARTYMPPEIDATIYQFNASSADLDSRKSTKQSPALGWGKVVDPSQIMTHRVPGNHASLMEDEECRKILAQIISQRLMEVNKQQ